MTLVGLGINLAMNVASFLMQWLAWGCMRPASAVSTLAASVDRDADLLLPLHCHWARSAPSSSR